MLMYYRNTGIIRYEMHARSTLHRAAYYIILSSRSQHNSMAAMNELARAKWVSKLVATDEVIRSVLLDAEPEAVDAVFRSSEIKSLLSRLLELSVVKSSPQTKVIRARKLNNRSKNRPISATSSPSAASGASSTKRTVQQKNTKRSKNKNKKRVNGKKPSRSGKGARTSSKRVVSSSLGAESPVVDYIVNSPKNTLTSDAPFLSSDEETTRVERDLEKTLFWGEINQPFGASSGATGSYSGTGSSSGRNSSNATPVSGNSGGGISDHDISPNGSSSPSGRRVSFAEDVWVQEIPKVEKSMINDLFYSEADIDNMYQEAEDEVLNATVPLTANGSSTGVEGGSGGFNSTI